MRFGKQQRWATVPEMDWEQKGSGSRIRSGVVGAGVDPSASERSDREKDA